MPSKTRRTRVTKASKENIVLKTTNLKESVKVLKSVRKPLSDKTNSASDDNASEVSEKPKIPVSRVHKQQLNDACEDKLQRSRRPRRLPVRYKENDTLKNLSNSFNLSSPTQDTAIKFLYPEQKKTSVVIKAQNTQNLVSKVTVSINKKASPVKKFKEASKCSVKTLNSSFVKNRPKRICRLPSKYEDHSVSPNKYIPLQPINASTPLATKSRKLNNRNAKSNVSALQNISPVKGSTTKTKADLIKKNLSLENEKVNSNSSVLSVNISPNDIVSSHKWASKNIKEKVVPDTNNNAKRNNKKQISPSKSPRTPGKIFRSRPKNNSIQLLGDNKNYHKRDSSNLDVYEFTYDPEDEPPPAKKKKKKAAPKKPKTKTVTIKSNYDRNLAKALAALKNTVASKSNTVQQNKGVLTVITDNINIVDKQTNIPGYVNNTSLVNEQELSVVNKKNYNLVRIEDIARDFQLDDDCVVDYSPINSPSRPKTPTNQVPSNMHEFQTPHKLDPLNLRNDLSFFDDIPVASSSMNKSVRHPQASPWRAEFGSLPIKWPVNTYVKSSMTPAYESSFINFNDDNKKKHIYTNMVAEEDNPLPDVENTPNLKQTSIISFIKEVVQKKENKKKRKSTPVKVNSLFEDLSSTSLNNPFKSTPLKNNTNVIIASKSGKCGKNKHISLEKQNNVINKTDGTRKDKTSKNSNQTPNINNTYFGFDDDNEDQENVSPVKKSSRAKSLRSRAKGILQEINDLKGPTRANLPITAKSKPAQSNVTRNEFKSHTEPPVFPDVAIDGDTNMTDVQSCLEENLENDDQCVHLFEDVDTLHIRHPKPTRKSYGKAKKVKFVQKPAASSDDESTNDVEGKEDSNYEDNSDDLSFKLPSERPKKIIKKRKPKKQLSKKEEKEVEAWAAGFNSMCEDVDGFDLLVE